MACCPVPRVRSKFPRSRSRFADQYRKRASNSRHIAAAGPTPSVWWEAAELASGEDLLDVPVISVLLWHLCALQRALCFPQEKGRCIK